MAINGLICIYIHQQTFFLICFQLLLYISDPEKKLCLHLYGIDTSNFFRPSICPLRRSRAKRASYSAFCSSVTHVNASSLKLQRYYDETTWICWALATFCVMQFWKALDNWECPSPIWFLLLKLVTILKSLFMIWCLWKFHLIMHGNVDTFFFFNLRFFPSFDIYHWNIKKK